MKKGIWKKVIALSLAAVMGLGLAACSGGDDNQGGQDGIGGGDEGTSGGVKTSQQGKENVYSYQELNLLGRNDNVSNLSYQDGKLYFLVYNYGGSGEETSENNKFGYYKANIDGSDSSFVELALPEREGSNSWINSAFVSNAGYVYAVDSCTYEDTSDPNNYVYEDRFYLDCWNMEGSLQWSKQIIANKPGEWSYCGQVLDGGEGRVLAVLSGNKNETVLYSPQGEEISRKEMSGDIIERSALIYANGDGTLTMIYNDEAYTKRYMASYDIEAGTLGEQTELPFHDNFGIRGGTGQDLLLANNMGLYTWSPGDAEPKMLMNSINSDLLADDINMVLWIDDQHFAAVYHDIRTYAQKCACFTYVDPADIPDKKELVLGGSYVGSEIRAKVIQFNQSNSQYRITLKDYSIYNSPEDWTAGQTRLNNDIISGKMPDIMMFTDLNSYRNYVSKGALADIGKLLAADPELGGLEYLQNVWDAYSVNGQLYAVIPSFNVQTMVAKKSLVGEPQSWTMADVEAVLATMPQGAAAFGDMTRDGFIYNILSYGGKDFIDLETGECHFDSQEFIDMLEYAKTLPKESYKEDEDYDYFSHENQYRENRSLMRELYISNIEDCKYQIKGYMGEEVSYVGFPTSDSKGSCLGISGSALMISANSQQQDEAWQFVRQFLTEEYQTSSELYSMPVLKSAFLAKAAKATERSYWTDENGNKEYYDDYWTINGEQVVLEPFTQEEVEEICQFIYGVNRTAYYNEEIRNIIIEDAEAFFSGQRSAQEVAGIIQSRAQVYINENR
ncbi:MAG: extracellular solute-binding protein [Lachnospiraceae bacterium]|jgi:ABC-type glycerol-3-phosphate transport system substrate-binding protein|nr:extracellular solute-binding protein [Lachnospiraceae bacterium]